MNSVSPPRNRILYQLSFGWLEDNMAYFNEKEAYIFLEMMEGLPSQDIAAENGLTFEELMECKDIIIDKLNQDTVAYTTKEGFLPSIF